MAVDLPTTTSDRYNRAQAAVSEAKQKMDRISDEMTEITDKPGNLSRGETERLERLSTGFDKAEADYAAARATWSTEFFTEIREGRTISESGHTTKDLDDDPFGEPKSVEDRRGRFSQPWSLNGDQWGTKHAGPVEMRSRALSAIEQMHGTNDARRETMTKIIEEFDDDDARLSRLLLATSSPAYVRAFTEAARNPAQPLLSQGEVDAVRFVRAEARAMSLTDAEGGYLVPFQLDPTVIITSDGTTNPVRQAARKVIATGDTWNGVSSAAVSWSVDAEATEVSDDATTFSQPSIPIYKLAGFVPISLEAAADASNVAQEVSRLLSFGKDVLEGTLLTTGTGSAQPTGIITELNGAAPPVISATTNDAFGSVDVYGVDEALPARYRANGTWMAHRATYNLVRQFDTSGGAAMWERFSADTPGQLLGRPALENSDMDGAIGAGDDYILVFGDFDNYVIADRIGMAVEFIPHLFGASQRPTGQRGWYAYSRLGAESVNDAAFKLLKV
jgi:HK97 family phage major capsid protein